MSVTLRAPSRLPWGLFLLIAAQIVCAVFFGLDVLTDFARTSSPMQTAEPKWHLAIEALATVSLWAAIVFETRYVARLLRRKAQLERNISVASAALYDVIEAFLDEWRLTAAERDVAALLIKGQTIAEIATARDSAEGTVKAHLNAIYRKSGARNRGDLLSLVIDQLLESGFSTADATCGNTGSPAAARAKGMTG